MVTATRGFVSYMQNGRSASRRTREALEQARIAPVAARERQRIEQARHAIVEDRAIIAAGLVTKRTGEPALAGAGLASDQEILSTHDPFAAGELGKQRLIEAARGLRVQILDNGALSQIGILETQYEPLALALDRFAIDEQAQPLLEGEALDIALASLFLECFRHAGEPKREQPIVGGMSEHFSSSSLVGPPVCGRAPRMRAVFRRARSDVLSGSSHARGCWRDGSAVCLAPVTVRKPCRAPSRGSI